MKHEHILLTKAVSAEVEVCKYSRQWQAYHSHVHPVSFALPRFLNVSLSLVAELVNQPLLSSHTCAGQLVLQMPWALYYALDDLV